MDTHTSKMANFCAHSVVALTASAMKERDQAEEAGRAECRDYANVAGAIVAEICSYSKSSSLQLVGALARHAVEYSVPICPTCRKATTSEWSLWLYCTDDGMAVYAAPSSAPAQEVEEGIAKLGSCRIVRPDDMSEERRLTIAALNAAISNDEQRLDATAAVIAEKFNPRNSDHDVDEGVHIVSNLTAIAANGYRSNGGLKAPCKNMKVGRKRAHKKARR